MVVGRIDVVGRARGRVLEPLELLHSHRERGPELAVAGDRLSLSAGEEDDAEIRLIAIDDQRDVAIERGENRGRTLRYPHVMRELTRLADWHGQPDEIELPLARLAGAGRSAAAILVATAERGLHRRRRGA
jgi:hypothetical protein